MQEKRNPGNGGAKRPGRRGAPAFRPTKPQRELVKMAVAMKIAEPKIAAQLGICQNTLRKHFSEELEFGRLRKTMENLMRLDKAAKGGNVSAMKYIDAKIAAANRASDEGDHVPPKGEKMGKKEQAARDAETAGQDTEWGDDLMPPTMSVN